MSGAAYWDCPACGGRFHESLVSEHWDHLVERVKEAEMQVASDNDALITLEARLRAAEESERSIQKDMDFLTEVSIPELMTRLRAAEEVVEAYRNADYREASVDEALRHYNEAVEE